MIKLLILFVWLVLCFLIILFFAGASRKEMEKELEKELEEQDEVLNKPFSLW